jgi:chaperonin GroES
MQTIKPAKHQIFARPTIAENKTKSGILLKEATEKPQTAEVINIGSEVNQFKPKDKIIYKMFTTTEIKLNDEQFILIDEEDVLGKVIET